MGHNLETRSLLDEIKSFDRKGGWFDIGHPLLNRMAESFVKADGIGAVQAVSKDAYLTDVDVGTCGDTSPIPPEIPVSKKKHRFSELRGDANRSYIEALVKGTGKESLQWGLAAGMYSGLTYGLREARGVHDWKNSAMAGAITGAALALTFDDTSHEDIVQGAITGAAISTAANLLTGIL